MEYSIFIIVQIILMWICAKKGDGNMSENVASTITVIGTIISIIVSLVIATKNTNSKIRDTQDKIRDTQDKISEVKQLCDVLIHNLGINVINKGSLTDQHDDIRSLIKEESIDQKRIMKDNINTVNELNERSKKELILREERERHLTPEMLEIKNVVTAIENMERQMEKLNADNAKKSSDYDDLQKKYIAVVSRCEELNQRNEKLISDVHELKSLIQNDIPDLTNKKSDVRK